MSRRNCIPASYGSVAADCSEYGVRALKELILEYAKHGRSKLVLEAYKDLIHVNPSKYVFVSVIKACASQGAYVEGKLVHAQVSEYGLEAKAFVASALINFYFKLKTPEDGQRVFDGLQSYDIVIWNAMIGGYAQCGDVIKMLELFWKLRASGLESNIGTWNSVIGACAHSNYTEEAFQLFYQMVQEGWLPEDITFASILNACTNIEAQYLGKHIHVHVIESGLSSDVFLGNTLINFYVKCRNFWHARVVLETLPRQDCVTWNALISGYSLHGNCSEALVLFQEMQKRGQSPDIVTWNALLMGHVQHGYAEKAMLLFEQMQEQEQEQGGNPDSVTSIHMLKACSLMSAIKQGMLLHAHLLEINALSDLVVCNSLINMYAKCGSLCDVYTVFKMLPKRDLVTWNSILAAYTEHGDFEAVFGCFENMQSEGFHPDEVTLLTILSACSRGGLVASDGSSLVPMFEVHGISPKTEQYSCMADLLGRKGCLQQALSLLNTTIMTSHLQAWCSLLSLCKVYGDIVVGRQCFDHILSLDKHHPSAYELMSTLYADVGMRENWRHL